MQQPQNTHTHTHKHLTSDLHLIPLPGYRVDGGMGRVRGFVEVVAGEFAEAKRVFAPQWKADRTLNPAQGGLCRYHDLSSREQISH